jgi:hypothetical protein
VTINVSSGAAVEYVVIGLKPASSTNFYDWGRATASNSNGTWSRTPQMPTVNPAPVCTNGVSSKVMWEVKYLIRLTNGTELQGVLPSRIARVFTGAYCPIPPDTAKPVVVDGSSEMVSGWSYYLGMTPVLSLIATDNVGVSRVTVSVIANGVLVSTHLGSLFSGPASNGIWRANLSFTGSDFVGNWQLKAVAYDAAGNSSSEVLLREIPVSRN